ncbi:MAG: ROK family transcriptional regulator [Lachnospiraceae bacterium]|nr:ROK family transcriptional regulator [Lachnospiraceae bacterium]
MNNKGMNSAAVKASNRAAVLKTLNRYGKMSRKDLAARLGLTAATVTIICYELHEAGVITTIGEASEKERRAGRKKILIDIDYTHKNVLCVGIEAEKTYIALTDLSGKAFAKETVNAEAKLDSDAFLKKIATACKKILRDNPSDKPLLGVGITVPGKVEGTRIKAFFEKELEKDVVVENNVRAFAEGELIYGNARELDNMLLVKWGPGVGSAIISNGRVYRGTKDASAEIGHTLAYKNGKKCRCGKTGCLETGISTHAIKDAVEEFKGLPVEKWKSVGEDKLLKLMHDKVDALAVAVCNASTMLDPGIVVIHGYMFNLPGVTDVFIKLFNKYSGHDDGFVVKSELADRQNLIGPLAIVMNGLFLKS